jgi:deoxycytidylate deaminase
MAKSLLEELPADISEFAPHAVWEEALHQAKRSPLKRFRVGCAIFDPAHGRILSRGCAHPTPSLRLATRSTHAEQHAVAHARRVVDLDGAWAVVVAINSNGNHTFSSRPCARCITTLLRAGVEQVLFCERTKNGMIVRSQQLADFTEAARAKEAEVDPCLCNARSLRLEHPASTVVC